MLAPTTASADLMAAFLEGQQALTRGDAEGDERIAAIAKAIGQQQDLLARMTVTVRREVDAQRLLIEQERAVSATQRAAMLALVQEMRRTVRPSEATPAPPAPKDLSLVKLEILLDEILQHRSRFGVDASPKQIGKWLVKCEGWLIKLTSTIYNEPPVFDLSLFDDLTEEQVRFAQNAPQSGKLVAAYKHLRNLLPTYDPDCVSLAKWKSAMISNEGFKSAARKAHMHMYGPWRTAMNSVRKLIQAKYATWAVVNGPIDPAKVPAIPLHFAYDRLVASFDKDTPTPVTVQHFKNPGYEYTLEDLTFGGRLGFPDETRPTWLLANALSIIRLKPGSSPLVNSNTCISLCAVRPSTTVFHPPIELGSATIPTDAFESDGVHHAFDPTKDSAVNTNQAERDAFYATLPALIRDRVRKAREDAIAKMKAQDGVQAKHNPMTAKWKSTLALAKSFSLETSLPEDLTDFKHRFSTDPDLPYQHVREFDYTFSGGL